MAAASRSVELVWEDENVTDIEYLTSYTAKFGVPRIVCKSVN